MTDVIDVHGHAVRHTQRLGLLVLDETGQAPAGAFAHDHDASTTDGPVHRVLRLRVHAHGGVRGLPAPSEAVAEDVADGTGASVDLLVHRVRGEPRHGEHRAEQASHETGDAPQDERPDLKGRDEVADDEADEHARDEDRDLQPGQPRVLLASEPVERPDLGEEAGPLLRLGTTIRHATSLPSPRGETTSSRGGRTPMVSCTAIGCPQLPELRA
ncbi:hypothetical protein ABE10_12310, partial [Bacillus toyonensis]|nr:hypothetical protein [Bacillus toyonensis]